MIVAAAVVTGFSYIIREKLFSFMGHVHIAPYDPTRSNSLTPNPIYYDRKLVNKLKKLPNVVQVTPFADRPVIIQAHNNMEGLRLKGVNSEYHLPGSITLTGKTIDYSDTFYSKQVILSQSIADKLDIKAGDTIQLEFFDANSMPRIRRVVVSGLYHSGMEEVDRSYGICDMRLLQRINNWTADSINAYQIDLDDEMMADTTAAYIHYNLIAPPVEAYTTVENYANLFDWIELTRVNGNVLMAIMAIVSIINMGAVLVMLMVDKATMIGLLKALGMPFGSTRNVFLYVAALIGGSGIVLGNIVAFVLCWLQQHYGIIKLQEDAYYMAQAPIKVIWWHVAVIDIATLVLSVVCMWLPAMYIRTIHPAKVLQFK